MNKKLLFSFFMLFIISSAFIPAGKPSLKAAKKILNGWCSFVPSGLAVVEGDTLSVQSFYMSSGEITNIQYLEFLSYLKRTNQTEKLAIAQIDTSKWIVKPGYFEPYAKYYHSHPAYREYPVVNISKVGAELFCEWLSMAYDSISNGELKLKFRIPTRAEWIRAARGDNHMYQYTWGGPYLRNSEGQYQANLLQVGEQNIERDVESGKLQIVSKEKYIYHPYPADNVDVTAPIKSYWPNEFGLYNMNGNVAEMIADGDFAVGGGWNSPGYDIRIESIRDFIDPMSSVGFRVVATHLELE